MDLSQFDTRQKADEGVSFPLIIEGETIYGDDGEPVTFSLRGINARDVQQYFITAKKKPDPATPDEALKNDMALLRLVVNGWSDNFEVEGEKYVFSRENVEKVFAVPALRGFAVGKILEQRGFMKGS